MRLETAPPPGSFAVENRHFKGLSISARTIEKIRNFVSIRAVPVRRVLEAPWGRPSRERNMVHQGSCHCGKVTFEVEGALTAALSCNCSICSKKAALLWALPRPQVRFQSGENELGHYLFNRHVIAHRFCPTCGIHTHGEDTTESGGT